MPIQKEISTLQGYTANYAVLTDMIIEYATLTIVVIYAFYKDQAAFQAGSRPITTITKNVPLTSVWSQEFLQQMGTDLETYLINQEGGEFENGNSSA